MAARLFLDEIGDMPLALQARLLRVLDERMVTPLGTDEAHPVDFQLLSASHRQLPQLVAEGRFREDLYYRLAGIELMLPALRERSDRAELIRDLLVAEGAPQAAVSPAAWDLLMQHPWPGNVRQLRHVLRSGVALADGHTLTPEHLPSLRLTVLRVPGTLVSLARPRARREKAATRCPPSGRCKPRSGSSCSTCSKPSAGTSARWPRTWA